MKVVIVHAEIVTGGGSGVVGLAGMGCGKVVGQGDALAGEPLHVWVAESGAVVGILEPYLVETLESLALHVGHWRQGSLCSLRSKNLRD